MTPSPTTPHARDPRTAAGRHRQALGWALGLNAGFLLVEVAGALWTGSLALLADAGHMLAHVGGLGLAFFATRLAARPPTPEKTFGYYRAEILAALVNALVLLGISAFILYEASRRFLDPPAVLGGPMLVIATLGLLVNLAGARLLAAGAGESLNIRGAYLEALLDALGSLGAIAAALIVLTTGWHLADPLIGAGIGLLILPSTWRLLRQTVNVLLEGVPPHVSLPEVAEAMRAVPGVRQVHDLHVWTLTSGKHAMSGHVVAEDLAEGNRILRDLHDLLHERFGIEHTTIQLESAPLLQIGTRGGEAPPRGA
jgi:cobalt-zinc-cadmium efflux system protein